MNDNQLPLVSGCTPKHPMANKGQLTYSHIESIQTWSDSIRRLGPFKEKPAYKAPFKVHL